MHEQDSPVQVSLEGGGEQVGSRKNKRKKVVQEQPSIGSGPDTPPRKKGRPKGSLNVVTKEKKQKQWPNQAKMSSYWSENHHKIISNPNKKDQPYCKMWGTSLTGMCPHCEMQQKNQPRCREWCQACEVPLHLACAFEYHARYAAVDREKWFQRNFVGGQAPTVIQPQDVLAYTPAGKVGSSR